MFINHMKYDKAELTLRQVEDVELRALHKGHAPPQPVLELEMAHKCCIRLPEMRFGVEQSNQSNLFVVHSFSPSTFFHHKQVNNNTIKQVNNL